MSALDLYVDGFPHGTRAGYQQGCRSNGGCPNKGTTLQTCVQADQRLRSDWDYQKLVNGGMSELEAAAALGAPDAPHVPRSETITVPVMETPLPAEPRPIPQPAFSAAQEQAEAITTHVASKRIGRPKADPAAQKENTRRYQRDYQRRKAQELTDLRAEVERLRAELAAAHEELAAQR